VTSGVFASIRDLGKHFADGTVALQGLNLTIPLGGFVSLLGPSGCGKSTLLRILAGLTRPSSGSIEFPHGESHAARGNPPGVGFVFQEPTLMPWASVMHNVALPLRLSRTPKDQAADMVRTALASVGLSDFAHAYPRQLSGGMKMRVSIARAIVTRPTFLLLDEPFAALDELTRLNLNNDLLELWSRERFTTVFVTHSVSEAVYLSQQVFVMAPRPGRVTGDYSIDIPPAQRTAEVRTSILFNDYLRTIAHRLREGAAS